MWIIEGLGQKMASNWAKRIQELTDLDDQALRFMSYHGENDEVHLGQLYSLIDRVCEDSESQRLIIRTARVVARLYLLQLEEIDHA
jgi:3-oxoacyl-[acyl-carrier-protein] synthase-3